jgi:hypothetical protein
MLEITVWADWRSAMSVLMLAGVMAHPVILALPMVVAVLLRELTMLARLPLRFPTRAGILRVLRVVTTLSAVVGMEC